MYILDFSIKRPFFWVKNGTPRKPPILAFWGQERWFWVFCKKQVIFVNFIQNKCTWIFCQKSGKKVEKKWSKSGQKVVKKWSILVSWNRGNSRQIYINKGQKVVKKWSKRVKKWSKSGHFGPPFWTPFLALFTCFFHICCCFDILVERSAVFSLFYFL